jgi:hypothetical protein
MGSEDEEGMHFIPLGEQIACIDREIRRREQAPPTAALLGYYELRELETLRQVARTLRALIDDGR